MNSHVILLICREGLIQNLVDSFKSCRHFHTAALSIHQLPFASQSCWLSSRTTHSELNITMTPTAEDVAKVLLFWYLIFAKSTQSYMVDGDPYRRAEYLDPENRYHLQWKVDFEQNRITFNVTVKSQGWILFGLANNNEEGTGKDVVIGGVMARDGKAYFSDRHENGNGGGVGILDKHQDYNLEEAWERRGETFLSFSRDLDTCDSEDYPITSNKVTVIWGYGDLDYYDIPRNNGQRERGSLDLYLLEPEYTPRIVRDSTGNPRLIGGPAEADDHLQLWSISVGIKMPEEHTSYLCTIHKAPRLKKKHHIIGFDVHLPDTQSLEHLHHFTLYKCNAPLGGSERDLYERFVGAPGQSCYFPGRPPTNPQGIHTQYCNQLRTGWALGGRAHFFPPQAGLPLGEEPDEYYLISAHYDNPQHKQNVQVNVQMDFWYTPRLRANDIGLMVVGGVEILPLPETILIPPKSSGHRVLGHCSPECTQRIFPPEGVTIISGLLHGHNSAVGMRLRHFDMEKKVELPWVTYDDNYSNGFQQFRHLEEEVRFLPGDQLTVECTYNNYWTNGSVIGGFSTSQEMCSAFLFYYGQIPEYSQCRSQIVDPEGRQRFLGGLENITWVEDEIDWVATSPRRLAGLTVTEIADLQDWTKEKREELQRYHLESYQVSSCSRDLFVRNRESLETALANNVEIPITSPSTRVETDDDFSGLVEYPFYAKPYTPNFDRNKCQLTTQKI